MDGVWDVFFFAKERLEFDQWGEFLAIAWCMWNTRNKYLFKHGFSIDVNVWTSALKFVSDFRKMAERTVDSGSIVRGGWSCPQPGCWKINFDGAKLGDWDHGCGMGGS